MPQILRIHVVNTIIRAQESPGRVEFGGVQASYEKSAVAAQGPGIFCIVDLPGSLTDSSCVEICNFAVNACGAKERE